MFSARDLAALIAVVDEGSIRGATPVLARTQPAITQAIQRLEEAVGFPLLDRSGYRVKLTERGEIFIKRARAVVKQAQDLKAFAAVLSRGEETRLRICVHGAVPTEAWVHLIQDLPDHFPDTVVEIQVGEGNAPIRRLVNNESDLAIALNTSSNHHTLGIESRLLGEVEFVSVVSAARLVSDEDRDLSFLPQIIVADFDDPETAYGVLEGHRYWRVSDHRMKAVAIIAGIGWGSVPSHLVKTQLSSESVRQISYRGFRPRAQYPFFLHQKRQAFPGPVASFIWEKCAQPAGEL